MPTDTTTRTREWPVVEIWSGAQTGADQAALRAAKALGYKTGGMIPKGHRTEIGPCPDLTTTYGLTESRFTGYEHRTRWNAMQSSGTLIFAAIDKDNRIVESGSALAKIVCLAVHKPYLVVGVDPVYGFHNNSVFVRDWIRACSIRVLNVAGNRESKHPGIGARVEAFLLEALRIA